MSAGVVDPRDPDSIKGYIRARQDAIMRETIGEERFKAFQLRRHLNAVCYKCPHVEHDGETLDVCHPPAEFHCMRQLEQQLIDDGLVIPQ